MSTTPEYSQFLHSKRAIAEPVGFEVGGDALNSMLFPFQRDIVRWALRRGRAAVFADCGLGKSIVQLDWARLTSTHTGKPTLILAPLAVAQQTAREGDKFGIPVTICRTRDDVHPGVNIANYEMLHHFCASDFGALVLDESSILKNQDGAYRQAITRFAQQILFRLACTATPAPNDLVEIINHAEYLSIMQGKEIIALYFTQDGNSSHAFRLKGHARREFWTWLATWAVALRTPSDLGHDDADFVLPPLEVHEHEVASPVLAGHLFAIEAQGLQERLQARRDSIDNRVAACAAMVNESDESWLVWCNLNAESDALARAIPDAVEVRGSDSVEHKEQSLLDFANGRSRVLISKPSIAGFGMNFQTCHNLAFVGISDSFESWYQAVRRCWRFGQTHAVHAHLITAEAEGAVVDNIKRKEGQATEMMDNLIAEMGQQRLDQSVSEEMTYRRDSTTGKTWTMHLGDSVDVLDGIESDSVGLTVFSPPFPGMYAYTNSMHDMGNVTSIEQMLGQFSYLVAPEKLLRVMMPGRICAIHLTQALTRKNREGYIGLADFRGRVISTMIGQGWVYHGEATIDKDPQLKAQRTKDRGLLFKSLANDSSVMHMALADYLIYFRKPGDNPRPIRAGISQKYESPDGWITNDEWIEWAAPVWYRRTPGYPGGIAETDVLNVRQARETDDERHLCPLQLGVIERAVKLWSAPGDLVLDPFAGIGSTGFEAIRLGRHFMGIELKGSYYQSAIQNLTEAERLKLQPSLLDEMPA